MRVDRFFLRVEEKNPASPWRVSLEFTNLALARVYGFLLGPMKNRLFHERRGRRTGAVCWDGSSS
jgi:hypothetical protein